MGISFRCGYGSARLAGTRRCLGRLLVGAIVLLALPGTEAEANENPMLIVSTQQGRIAGESEGDLEVFRGIPFAAPPVGKLRWRPPVPSNAWSGVRDAKVFAPACTQTPNPLMNVPSQPVSEDCLYLNVWTPARHRADRLPVLVWIHGGGFAFGSTAMPLFDGAAFARKGVVFVSTTYRLGPFGFLAHPALSHESPHGVSGNYALLDQIAALDWVGKNIEAFGGDPGRITIMGESVGGISVSLLIQSPLARGLFHGAIAESGAAVSLASGNIRTLQQAEQSGERLAARAGASTLRDLRLLPADQVLQATEATSPFTRTDSWPVLDGYVLPADPVQIYRQHRQHDTPILIGSNDREGDLFPHERTIAGFQAYVRDHFGPVADKVLAAYPARDDQDAERSAADLAGDWTFGIQDWTWARLQSQFGSRPVFYYHFEHSPPPRPGVPAGPIHGAELPYVFGTLDIRPIEWTAADRALSELLMTYWTNFVKTGNPNGAGLPQWPAFTVASPQVMYFRNGQGQLGPVPHQARLRLFDPLEQTLD